ncbi:MAG: LytR C-terminal domain-containing protein [bacterium]
MQKKEHLLKNFFLSLGSVVLCTLIFSLYCQNNPSEPIPVSQETPISNNSFASSRGYQVADTDTPTATETDTITETPTESATETVTQTPTNTATNTPTNTTTNSTTATITNTPTNTFSSTLTATPSSTFSSTPTWTASPTKTATYSPTFTFSPTRTFTGVQTVTTTITLTPTITWTSSITLTPINTPTGTPPTATPALLLHATKKVIGLSTITLFAGENQLITITGNSSDCFTPGIGFFVYLNDIRARTVIVGGETLQATFNLANIPESVMKLTVVRDDGIGIGIDLSKITDQILVKEVPSGTKSREAAWLIQDHGTWGKDNAFVVFPGEYFDIDVDFKNTGLTRWTSDKVGMYVYKDPFFSSPLQYNDPANPYFGQSVFSNQVWGRSYNGKTPNAKGGIMLQDGVDYNEAGTFRIRITIPPTLGANRMTDNPDTTNDDTYYREDFTLAYETEWMDNTTNGDPINRAHTWFPFRVIPSGSDKGKNLYRIDILSSNNTSAQGLAQLLTDQGYRISKIGTFHHIDQPAIHFKGKAQYAAERLQATLVNAYPTITLIQNETLIDGDLVITL